MIGGVIVVLGIIACLVVAWVGRGYAVASTGGGRVADQYAVHLADVPKVFEQLKEQGSDGSFAVFMFSDQGRPGEENSINLQFSIEDGRVGLDWELLAPVNIRDERRIFDFLSARGSKPSRLTMNGVTYLRAEEGNLVQLCQHIMSGLYGVTPGEQVDLLPEGFTWTQ